MLISAVIIAGNEEEKIADAIRSVGWADEVLVVDSISTDRTVEIAESLGAKVISREWTGFSDQKQFAVDQASNDWVFSLDADERVSEALRADIQRVSAAGETCDAYRMPRLSFYMGREIRNSGWYPDRQLRLFDRRSARWNGAIIHESVKADSGGVVCDLVGEILHFSGEDAAHHHRMIGERYAPLSALQAFENGRRTTLLKIAAAAPAAFLSTYFLKLGLFDGFPGFVIAKFAAHHAFLKNLMLWELQNNRPSSGATTL